jgi:hypothetical protein
MRLLRSLKRDDIAHPMMSRPNLDQMRLQFEEINRMIQEYMNVPSLIAKADELRRSLDEYCGTGGGSKLTPEKRSEIRRLVNAGANLHGVDALHHVSSFYGAIDLFDLLIDEYGMGVNQRDEDGNMPLHVAATVMNVDAVRILLSKGADRRGVNGDGKTPLQELNEMERRRDDMSSVLMGMTGRAQPADGRSALIMGLLTGAGM